MAKHISKIESWLRNREADTTNDRGNIIKRVFMPSERYLVDFAKGFHDEGWFQYDTDQDAHYFGVWINPTRQLVITYAEGDWSIVECMDAEHYKAEILSMNAFYGEGFICKAIDTDSCAITVCRQNREDFVV